MSENYEVTGVAEFRTHSALLFFLKTVLKEDFYYINFEVERD